MTTTPEPQTVPLPPVTLTDTQLREVSAAIADYAFGSVAALILGAHAGTASINVDDLKASAQSLDNTINSTLNSLVTAGNGALSIISVLDAAITYPVNRLQPGDREAIIAYVFLKRGGLI